MTGKFVPGQYVAGCRSDGSIHCGHESATGGWQQETFHAGSNAKTAALHRDSTICVVDDAGAIKCRHGMSEGGVSPAWVPLASPAPVEQLVPVAVGFCARHTDGRVSCWVDHRYDNDDDFLEGLPKKPRLSYVDGIENVTQLAAGQGVVCAITKTREVWCFHSENGKPNKLPTLTGATSLGANHVHTCAVVEGDVWCWGDNFLGQLGTGTGTGRIDPITEPVKVKASFKAVKVGTGRSATCALDDHGKVWCWGANESGQLGLPHIKYDEGWSKVVGIGPART
jgi:hypothetical protein